MFLLARNVDYIQMNLHYVKEMPCFNKIVGLLSVTLSQIWEFSFLCYTRPPLSAVSPLKNLDDTTCQISFTADDSLSILQMGCLLCQMSVASCQTIVLCTDNTIVDICKYFNSHIKKLIISSKIQDFIISQWCDLSERLLVLFLGHVYVYIYIYVYIYLCIQEVHYSICTATLRACAHIELCKLKTVLSFIV